MDDDDLVARVAAGHDTALRELFGRHASGLAVLLRALLSAADVEDVLQEPSSRPGAAREATGRPLAGVGTLFQLGQAERLPAARGSAAAR